MIKALDQVRLSRLIEPRDFAISGDDVQYIIAIGLGIDCRQDERGKATLDLRIRAGDSGELLRSERDDDAALSPCISVLTARRISSLSAQKRSCALTIHRAAVFNITNRCLSMSGFEKARQTGKEAGLKAADHRRKLAAEAIGILTDFKAGLSRFSRTYA